MRVYVAGSTKAIDEVKSVIATVIGRGHEITFDWTGSEGQVRTDWSSHQSDARSLSLRERAAVERADAVVMVAPPKGQGLGLYIEVGMALALRKRVIVIGAARESVFWYLPGVLRYLTVEGAIEGGVL